MLKSINYKKLASTFLALSMITIYGFVQLQPVVADSIWDRIINENDGGLEEIGDEVFGGETPQMTIPEVVARIIKYLLTLLGIIFIALIIYGGFVYMISTGEEDKISSAKNIMISATIGLAIIIASYAITYFVLESLTKATGTN